VGIWRCKMWRMKSSGVMKGHDVRDGEEES